MFDFLKGKKYKKEVEELKARLDDINLIQEESEYLDIKEEIKKLENKKKDLNLDIRKELEQLQNKKNTLNTDILSLENQIKKLKNSLIDLNDEQELQSYGLYNTKYGLESSEIYKAKLDNIRREQKDLIKMKVATNHSLDWVIDNNKKKGKEFILDTIKLSLKAFNNECDNIIAKVKFNNVEKSIDRINKSYKEINSLTDMQNVSITNKYLNLKIEELYLKYEYECKKQEEKEEQQAIKERMREEAKVLKEIELANKKIEKEETHFKNAIEDLNKKIEYTTDNEKEKLIKKLNELHEKLKEVEFLKEDVLNRERNTRAGYVYIISNIGSFGENIYKIGMTRRLDPNDRVRELGSASVPFNFDVHAMIFSEDAPALENSLHKRFSNKQVNKVNSRKEFFYVSLSEIEQVVKEEFDKPVEFTKLAKAEEYRKSILSNEVNYDY